MKTARRSLYFMTAFVLTSGVLFTFLRQLGLFEVKAIPVEIVPGQPGEKNLAPEEQRLKDRLQSAVKSFAGKRVWDVDLGELRAAIAGDEWVKDVLISRAFPNEVRVRVRAKSAVLNLVSSDGHRLIPVTEEGLMLSPLAAGLVPDAPLLRGERFFEDVAKRREVVKLLRELPESGPLSRENISEIAWSSDDGFRLTLMEPKTEVKLGSELLELKALRAAQVVSYLSAHSLKSRVIDASFSKKVLVRLRKGS